MPNTRKRKKLSSGFANSLPDLRTGAALLLRGGAVDRKAALQRGAETVACHVQRSFAGQRTCLALNRSAPCSPVPISSLRPPGFCARSVTCKRWSSKRRANRCFRVSCLFHTPGPGEVLVRIAACAVCRTDLHVVDGELPDPKLPLVPGHEIVGTHRGYRRRRISLSARRARRHPVARMDLRPMCFLPFGS